MPDGKDEMAQLIQYLLDEVKAAEMMMDRLRWQMSNAAEWRTQKLAKLKEIMPVNQIADRLGVTRQAVYAGLGKNIGDSTSIEDKDVRDLVEELSVISLQSKNIADRKTPSIDPGAVGWMILSEVTAKAAEMLSGMQRDLEDTDHWHQSIGL